MTWRRGEHLERIEERFDLCVVGGGIVGAGITLDAAHRGKSVVVIDRDDWATGTSSRSTKLLHGGVRYLPQLRFGMIRRGLKEQRVLGRIADYLVEPIDFVIPVYKGRGFADAPAWARHPRIFPIAIRLGLWWYDRLGVHSEKTQRVIGAEALQERFPQIRTAGLRHGIVYRDAQTDDARLTLMVVRTAVDHGAVATSYLEATDIAADSGGWRIDVKDRVHGGEHRIWAKQVVAATGAEDPPGHHGHDLSMVLSKGVHVTMPTDQVDVQHAALVLPETSDRRVLFLVPWKGRVIIGTTDTPYEGDPIHPRANDEDVAYLTAEVQEYLDVPQLDPVSAWAGLRALVGSPGAATAKASREHEILEVAPGYIRVAGGKLTGYRAIADDVVDRLYGSGGKDTAKVELHGAGLPGGFVEDVELELTSLGVPERLGPSLVARYGTEVRRVLDIAHDDTRFAARIAEDWLAAEVVYGARHESVATITDVVQRRTRMAWFTDDHSRSSLREIGELLTDELGWDEKRLRWELERVEADLQAEGL